ncbi:hypothetical protein JHK86_038207 [Glycine max]|nr:hypothetical protein JHK86_038207 [Glycine max]
MMGGVSGGDDDFVQIHQPNKPGDPFIITFNCPDKTGLACDICRIILDFGLCITKGGNLPALFSLLLYHSATFQIFSCLSVEVLLSEKFDLELLHTRNRQDETCERLNAVLRDSCTSCELQLAGPEYEYNQGISSLSPALAEELELSDNQISYGRFSPNSMGYRDLDIFIQQNDGKKILDREKQSALCSHLKQEMLHPLRVIIANRGPDTELLVANPVELSGIGRPRVFYDVTFALKTLGICVFSAEVGRHSTSEREWEVYRFLLDENCEFQLTGVAARNKIVNRVRRTLMGW